MKTSIRIGINLLFLIPGGVGGTEIYCRALLESLARVDSTNHYFVYRNRETNAGIVPQKETFHDRPQPVMATSRPARIFYEQIALPFAFARDRIDVALNGGFTAPLFTPVPMVTVFYDLQHLHFGSTLRTPERLATSILFPASARRSKRLVLMTKTAESELVSHYAFARTRTLVVPHGVDPDFRTIAARRRVRSPSAHPFILAVSSLMMHKNFDTLLRGFAQVKKEHRELRLVVAGIRGSDTHRLETIRDELGLRGAVDFTGWIPRTDLLELFATAEAFVFASRYEGFGIPVLEALTAGLPIACSDIPVLREIAGDAACYFDPRKAGSIARCLTSLLHDQALVVRLRLAGSARLQRFDWDVNVTILIAALNEVALGSRR